MLLLNFDPFTWWVILSVTIWVLFLVLLTVDGDGLDIEELWFLMGSVIIWPIGAIVLIIGVTIGLLDMWKQR